jgi:cytochrome c
MKSIIIVSMVAAAGLMVAGSAGAIDLPAVGKAKCGACHSVEKKIVGPAYKDVSAKYKDDKDAVSKMIEHATKGGEFGWKLGKMPPRGLGATDAEIKEMAEFIAGLAK